MFYSMKIRQNALHYQKGLSISEVLVYVSISILMLGIIIRVMTGTFAIFARARTIQSLGNTGSAITERITYNVRNATGFSLTGNSFGVNPGTLSIVVPDAGGTSHTYYYEKSASGQLTETVDGGSPQYLHGTAIIVDTFQIDQISAGSYRGAKITITLRDTRIPGDESATFTTSILMRGTY